MEKFKINMIGGGFQHLEYNSASPHGEPKYVEWDKAGNQSISMHIDNAIMWQTDKNKKNYAWICESFSIVPQLREYVVKNIKLLEDKFELIFTFDSRILHLSNKFKLVPCCAIPWVNNYEIYNKTKLVSMVASTKVMCEGHKYRQVVAEKYKNAVDCFGRGRKYINNKDEALMDYCFSITMENDKYVNFFTEKISDCFATGTIPIYWGAPDIGNFFDERGIIELTDDFDINSLSMDLYYSKMEYIIDNFERVKSLPTTEDYIYENYLK